MAATTQAITHKERYYNRVQALACKFLGEISEEDEYPSQDEIHQITTQVIDEIKKLEGKEYEIGVTDFNKFPAQCPVAGDIRGVFHSIRVSTGPSWASKEYSVTISLEVEVLESISGSWAWNYSREMCSEQSHKWIVRATGKVKTECQWF